MKKRFYASLAFLALLAGAVFAAGSANAAAIAKTDANGAVVVLTDEVNEELCPVGTRMAVAVLPNEKQIPGCWKPLPGNKIGILWLAIDVIPQGYFEPIPPDMKS